MRPLPGKHIVHVAMGRGLSWEGGAMSYVTVGAENGADT
jgi:hypothetical protein